MPPKPDGARIKYANRNSEYGWSVLQLQERLNQVLKQSTPLRVDGDYGPLTEAAVKEFQKLRELPVTGDVDDITRAALGFVEPEGTLKPGRLKRRRAMACRDRFRRRARESLSMASNSAKK